MTSPYSAQCSAGKDISAGNLLSSPVLKQQTPRQESVSSQLTSVHSFAFTCCKSFPLRLKDEDRHCCSFCICVVRPAPLRSSFCCSYAAADRGRQLSPTASVRPGQRARLRRRTGARLVAGLFSLPESSIHLVHFRQPRRQRRSR